MNSQRIKKVASSIKKELANALLFESRNPLFREVVITRVEVTKDLRIANVFYTNYLHRDSSNEAMETQLRKATPFFMRVLKNRISMKYFPELRFRYDTTTQKLERIETILKEIKEK